MRTLIFVLTTLFSANAWAQDDGGIIDAKEAFEARQADLVLLAQHFGELHRLRQLCGPAGNQDLFRDRMRALVPLESPMGGTRLDMIAAFNDGYRETSREHNFCGDEAETAYGEIAANAMAVTDRLFAPFR